MFNRKRIGICYAVTVAAGVLGIASAAEAFQRNVTFCNKTNAAVDVAWGYDRTGTSETTSEGWKTVQNCRCTNLFRQDVRATEFWVYVKKPRSALEDALTSGKGPLCIRAREFTFRTSNQSREVCTKHSDNRWVNFQMADATKENFKLNFGSGGNCIDEN
jgi:uncharacterized membrane protein